MKQLSCRAMLGLGIIIVLVSVFIPAFIWLYAWLTAKLLIIGGIVFLLTWR